MEVLEQQPWKVKPEEEEEEEEEEEQVAPLSRRTPQLNNSSNGATDANGVNHEAENGEPTTVTVTVNLTKEVTTTVSSTSNHEQPDGNQASKFLQNSVYFDPHQANGSANGVSEIISTTADIASSLFKAEESGTRKTASEIQINETQVVEDVDLVEEVDEELTDDLDVETVIKKQNTHDIFCPNCKSCITKRVILRRRPKLHRLKSKKTKPGKPSNAKPDQSEEGSPQHVFRCLECFTYFIPTVSCFDMFRPSEDGNRKTWLSNFFKPDKTVAAAGEGAGTTQPNQQDRPVVVSGNQTPFENEKPLDSSYLNSQQGYANPSLHNHHDTKSSSSQDPEAVRKTPLSSTQEHRATKLDPITGGNSLNDPITMSNTGPDWRMNMKNGNRPDEQKPSTGTQNPIQSEGNLSMENSFLNYQQGSGNPSLHNSHDTASSYYGQALSNGSATEALEAGKNIPLSSTQEYKPTKLNPITWGNNLNDPVKTSNTGLEWRVNMNLGNQPDERPPSMGTQNPISSSENLLQLGTALLDSPGMGAEASEARSWDILKSFVYGGLGESITSLSIISSAAAGGATTLNILALGLANVIGGLFVIGNNLRELKNEHGERYEQVLGERRNSGRHAVVSLLSFIIFGLVAPIVYGFTFRKSDEKDLKIAAVAGSSLACVILLAVGKAHIQNQSRNLRSYIKTVVFYVSMGIMVSGASYAVGDLAKRLLEKYGWVDASRSLNMMNPLPATSIWASS